MPPIKVYHSAYQGKIAALLYVNADGGRFWPNASLILKKGQKSRTSHGRHPNCLNVSKKKPNVQSLRKYVSKCFLRATPMMKSIPKNYYTLKTVLKKSVCAVKAERSDFLVKMKNWKIQIGFQNFQNKYKLLTFGLISVVR